MTNTFEQLINTGDCFTQVSLYQLLREDGRVFIFVHKILAGAGKGSFMAHPTHLVVPHKDEYVRSYRKITRRGPQRLPCKNQRGTHQRHGRRSIAVSKIIYDLPVRFQSLPSTIIILDFISIIVQSSFEDLVAHQKTFAGTKYSSSTIWSKVSHSWMRLLPLALTGRRNCRKTCLSSSKGLAHKLL